jgi:hypothetical protein
LAICEWFGGTAHPRASAFNGLSPNGTERKKRHKLAVAPSTIRTHLLQVFAKTGTSRQADLVRLISQIG